MTPPTQPVNSDPVSQGQPPFAILRPVTSTASLVLIQEPTTPYHPTQNACSHLPPSWQKANPLPSFAKSYKQLAATLVRGLHIVFGTVLTATCSSDHLEQRSTTQKPHQ
jgi:hypothetical protein